MSRIGNLTRLIHTLIYVTTIHTYLREATEDIPELGVFWVVLHERHSRAARSIRVLSPYFQRVSDLFSIGFRSITHVWPIRERQKDNCGTIPSSANFFPQLEYKGLLGTNMHTHTHTHTHTHARTQRSSRFKCQPRWRGAAIAVSHLSSHLDALHGLQALGLLVHIGFGAAPQVQLQTRVQDEHVARVKAGGRAGHLDPTTSP